MVLCCKKILFLSSLINSIIMVWFIGKIDHKIVALHYDIYGNVNFYGSKWTLTFFAVIPIILSLVFWLYKSKNYEQHNSTLEDKIISVVMIFFFLIGWTIIVVTSGNPQKLDVWVLSLIVGLLGLLIMFISILMPKIKSNKYFGIRTSATLKSEVVWEKTHKLVSYTGTAGGILTTFFAIFASIINIIWLCYVGIACGIIGVIIPAIYSRFLANTNSK